MCDSSVSSKWYHNCEESLMHRASGSDALPSWTLAALDEKLIWQQNRSEPGMVSYRSNQV